MNLNNKSKSLPKKENNNKESTKFKNIYNNFFITKVNNPQSSKIK